MITPKWIFSTYTPRVKGKIKIPIYSPIVHNEERVNIETCLLQNWYSSKGSFVSEFEKLFARYVDMPYAVSCSSGTAALFLSLQALGVKRGDEVIVPDFTMASTAFAVSYCGARPIFVDCDGETGNIDITKIEKYITSKTKVIIPVHIYGAPCDMDTILEIATKYDIHVLEDAAEAFGSTYKNQKIGSISNISAFSLYVNKIVTTGEGGIITLRSKKSYAKLKKLNNYSYSKIRHFWHNSIGYNFRMSNLEAALGVGQLHHVEETLAKKKVIHQIYGKYLESLSQSLVPLTIPIGSTSNYWHIAYRLVDRTIDRMKLRKYLAGHGVETRSFFIPMHLQPVYRKYCDADQFPQADILGETGLLFPSGPGLTRDQIEYICSLVGMFIDRSHAKKRI